MKRAILIVIGALGATLAAPGGVARAQSRAPGPAAQIAAGEIVAGQELGAAYYASMLQLYGGNAASSTPAQRAQMAQAMSEYFTNGAKATALPTSGPAAAYFTNGAAAVGAPASAMPSYSMTSSFPTEVSTAVTAEATAAAAPEAGPPAATADASPVTPPAMAPPSAPVAPVDDGGATMSIVGGGASLSEPPAPPAPPTGRLVTPPEAPPVAQATPVSETTPLTPAGNESNALPREPGESPPGVTNVMPAEPVTHASTILVPMAAGVGFAALLIAIGLSIQPHVRRFRRRS
ncbi:MAG TPA: hypothetical protein VHV30_09360 [Polyangiaceae bacterium]|nr:hypothetical protein [Polyangiaceae bacterium]